MDGQPLRYKVLPDGSSKLYSWRMTLKMTRKLRLPRRAVLSLSRSGMGATGPGRAQCRVPKRGKL